LATSPQLALALRAARIAPGLVDRAVTASTRRAVRRGRFRDATIAAELRRSLGGT
jgi:hypothetical protein